MSVNLNTAAPINMQPINLQGMDIETALMMVQSQRANLLEGQLTNQLSEVQKRNEQIGKLNQALNALNAASAAFPSDAKSDSTIQNWDDNKVHQIEIPLNDALKEAGITDAGFGPEKGQTSTANYRNGQNVSQLPSGPGIMKGSTTKAQIDAAINSVKSMIDSANNSNQMDMLRLQSLTNKRNEAFDVMSNFIKKMQDSRSSIVGNMR